MEPSTQRRRAAPRGASSVAAALLALAAARPVAADPMPDYFRRGAQAHAEPAARSPRQWALVGGLLGGAVLAGAVGLQANLASRDAADEVSASLPTGEPWDAAHQASADRAASAGRRATLGYGLGGALLIGAAVAYVLTGLRPAGGAGAAATAAVAAPTPGGAVVGAAWRF